MKKFPKVKNSKAGKSEAQLEARLPVPKPAPAREPDWLETLPDHLDEFGQAIGQERKTCAGLLTDAMEAYADAVYDAVIDGTPKDVLDVMKRGLDGIISQADNILAIACACAEDHAPNLTLEVVLAQGAEDDPRILGESIGSTLSITRSLGQDMLCKALVGNLSSDAREALLNALLP